MRRFISYVALLLCLVAFLSVGKWTHTGYSTSGVGWTVVTPDLYAMGGNYVEKAKLQHVEVTTAWTYAGTGATVDRDSKVAWTNPSNATSDNGVFATCAIGHPDTYGDWLRMTNFGFAIPATAKIEGIRIRILCHEGNLVKQVSDSSIRLQTPGLGQIGEDHASSHTEVYAYNIDSTYYRGGVNDAWLYDVEGLTPTIVNSTGFGVDISCYNDDPNFDNTVYVDDVSMMVKYTTVQETYRPTYVKSFSIASQANGFQSHGACLDDTTGYLYGAYILNTMSSATGAVIVKCPKALDRDKTEAKRFHNTIPAVAFQALTHDKDYLYAVTNPYLLSGTTVIHLMKIAKSSLAGGTGTFPTASADLNTNSASNVMNAFTGLDYAGTPMVYVTGVSNLTVAVATGGPIWQVQTSDLTTTAGKAVYHIPNTYFLMGGACDVADATNHYPLYVVGQDASTSHIAGIVAKITQGSGRALAIENVAYFYNSTYDVAANWGAGANFTGIDIDGDSGHIWVAGFTRKSSASTEYGDIVLAKLNKSDMLFDGIWRITSTVGNSNRGLKPIVRGNNIYVSSWFFPHSGIAGAGNNESSVNEVGWVMKLDKAKLEAGDLSGCKVWCKAFDHYHEDVAAHQTMIQNMFLSKDGFLYAFGHSDAFDTYQMPFWVKINADKGTTTDYTDASSLFREREEAASVTITDITATNTSPNVTIKGLRDPVTTIQNSVLTTSAITDATWFFVPYSNTITESNLPDTFSACATCPTDTPNVVSATSTTAFGDNAANSEIDGNTFTTTDSVKICKVYFILTRHTGTITSHHYTAQIWTMNGTSLDTAVATSGSVAGDQSWSKTNVCFTFSTPYTLAAGTAYAVTVVDDTGDGAYIDTWTTANDAKDVPAWGAVRWNSSTKAFIDSYETHRNINMGLYYQ